MNIIDYGALNNKYTTWYNRICQHALTRYTTRKSAKMHLGYVEGHHIIPKCILPNKTIVYLTMREHFLVHWLLSKMFTGEIRHKLLHALTCMSRGKHRKLTSRQLEICRKAKIVPCSEQRAKSISNARKLTTKIKCEFCNASFDNGNYTQYHGTNCKQNPNIDKNILLDRRKRAISNSTTQIKNGKFHKVQPVKGDFTCPHCNKKGTNYGSMCRFHFNNCSQLTGIQHKTKLTIKLSCINCHKEIDTANWSRHRC